jgi:hypothetical protein
MFLAKKFRDLRGIMQRIILSGAEKNMPPYFLRLLKNGRTIVCILHDDSSVHQVAGRLSAFDLSCNNRAMRLNTSSMPKSAAIDLSRSAR